MRAVDVLRPFGPLLMTGAVILLASRRRVVRHFESGRAFDATSAIESPASRMPLIAWWGSRLERAGVLRRAPDGRRWLDQSAWRRYRLIRKRRALVVVCTLVTLMTIAYYWTSRG